MKYPSFERVDSSQVSRVTAKCFVGEAFKIWIYAQRHAKMLVLNQVTYKLLNGGHVHLNTQVRLLDANYRASGVRMP